MTSSALAALLCAALFTGAVCYISFVEHPARLLLDDRALLAQWQPSYSRALPLQSGLAIAGSVAGFAAFYLSGNWLWVLGGVVLLANWPVTLLVIMPTNKRLKAIAPRQAGPESRGLLLKWGRLHDVRSGLGAAATLLFALALADLI